MKTDIPFGEVELANGIVPVTEAAGSLAGLLKRVRESEHIILTQKGRTAAVIISIEDYTKMRELALQQLEEHAK